MRVRAGEAQGRAARAGGNAGGGNMESRAHLTEAMEMDNERRSWLSRCLDYNPGSTTPHPECEQGEPLGCAHI